MNITRAHLFSRLFFAAGTWPTLNKAEHKVCHSAAMHVWRRCTGTTYSHRKAQSLASVSDSQVINEHELMAPYTMVILLRLNLLIRIAASDNSVLKCVIYAARLSQKSWLAAVQSDFGWLKSICEQAQYNDLDRFSTLSQLVADMSLQPIFWKKQIKKICGPKHANFIDEDNDGPTASLDQLYVCQDCQYACTSSSQLANHAFIVHGKVREARFYVDDMNSCPACLRRFSSRTQALKHVTNSNKCKGYADVAERVPDEEAARMDSSELERRKLLQSHGAASSCSLSHLETLQGPLVKQYVSCFKSRPRYPVVEGSSTLCPAAFYRPCSSPCLLCEGIT